MNCKKTCYYVGIDLFGLQVVEKENPRHRGFSTMKLYYRAELRRRARKRYGGKEGLIEERRKREEKRFENDIAKTKDIFKK